MARRCIAFKQNPSCSGTALEAPISMPRWRSRLSLSLSLSFSLSLLDWNCNVGRVCLSLLPLTSPALLLLLLVLRLVLRPPVSRALGARGQIGEPALNPSKTVTTVPPLLYVEVGRLENFRLRKHCIKLAFFVKLVLNSVSLLRSNRASAQCPSLPSPSSIPFSLYRYASKRSCPLREGLLSIGMGSVNIARPIAPASYLGMQRNIRKISSRNSPDG